MWFGTPRPRTVARTALGILCASAAFAADPPPGGPVAPSPAFMLRDIWPGPWGPSSPIDPGVGALGGTVFFSAADPDNGIEVWRTDGTRAGTRLVKDIYPGPWPSDPRLGPHVEGASAIYFIANDGLHSSQLWKTNGKPSGTRVVKDLSPGVWAHKVIGHVGTRLFFSTSEGVMVTDGTEAGTQPIARNVELCDSFNFALAPDAVYFVGSDGAIGCELWRTDGTAAGTRLVKDVDPSPGSVPFRIVNLMYSGGLVYFDACYEALCTLWRSDGSEEGTFDLDVTTNSFAGTPRVPFRDTLLLVRSTPEYGSELWRTDGSVAGTVLVKDVNPGPGGGIGSLDGASQGDAYVFFAIDAQHGREPWRTDGTAAGTYLLRDLQPGPSGYPWNNLLGVPGVGTFFMGNDGINGHELWLTDGYTAAGTRPITNFAASIGVISISPKIATDRFLLFIVGTPALGGEPWAYELGAIPQ